MGRLFYFLRASSFSLTQSPGLYNTAHPKKQLLLNYITLPVLAKYTFAGSGFSLYAGPQIGYLVSAKLKTSNNNGSGSISNKDGYKSTDFGAVAGLEFEIPNTKLNISGRYQFGLTKIGDNTGAGDNKNAAATFTVGYRLK